MAEIQEPNKSRFERRPMEQGDEKGSTEPATTYVWDHNKQAWIEIQASTLVEREEEQGWTEPATTYRWDRNKKVWVEIREEPTEAGLSIARRCETTLRAVLRRAVATSASVTIIIRSTKASKKLIGALASLALLIVALALTGLLIPGWGVDEQPPTSGPVDTIPDSSDTSYIPGSVLPANKWVNFYSLQSTLDGQPFPVGTVITAHDPQGVVCGEFSVTQPGRYGLMPVYADDPSTEVDEGAIPGDLLEFRIDGIQARVPGLDEPVWTAMGDLKQVNLAAYTAP